MFDLFRTTRPKNVVGPYLAAPRNPMSWGSLCCHLSGHTHLPPARQPSMPCMREACQKYVHQWCVPICLGQRCRFHTAFIQLSWAFFNTQDIISCIYLGVCFNPRRLRNCACIDLCHSMSIIWSLFGLSMLFKNLIPRFSLDTWFSRPMHLPFCLMQFAHIPEEESAIRGDRSTFCSCLALQPHNIVDLSAHMGGRHPMLAGNTSYSIHFSPKANPKNWMEK